MDDINEQPLAEALVETLETMAFVSAVPLENVPPLPEDRRLIRLRYHGARDGVLELAAPAALGQIMAENMLGPADDPAEALHQAEDALREALNVIGGALFRREAAEHMVIEMNIPELSTPDMTAWETLFADPSAVRVEAEGHAVALRIETRKPT